MAVRHVGAHRVGDNADGGTRLPAPANDKMEGLADHRLHDTRYRPFDRRGRLLHDVKERVLATGAVPVGDTPEAFTAFMNKERHQLGEVIAKRGIELKV